MCIIPTRVLVSFTALYEILLGKMQSAFVHLNLTGYSRITAWSHYGPGVDSASNRNEYQVYFLGVKAAGA